MGPHHRASRSLLFKSIFAERQAQCRTARELTPSHSHDVRFSNRPFRVKRFQTIHQFSVDRRGIDASGRRHLGYCEETGERVSLKRLDARPIATLSVEAQERHERRERFYRNE